MAATTPAVIGVSPGADCRAGAGSPGEVRTEAPRRVTSPGQNHARPRSAGCRPCAGHRGQPHPPRPDPERGRGQGVRRHRRSALSTPAATSPFYCALNSSPTRSCTAPRGSPAGRSPSWCSGSPARCGSRSSTTGPRSSTPVVKGEVLAPDGHGLFLVDQLADSWGYVLDQVGTTVWFRLTG